MQEFPPLTRLRTQRVIELCSHFQPSADACELLVSFEEAGPLLHALIERRLWRDAALLLAHGLHKRTAIWWCCLVCRDQLAQSENSGARTRELAAIENAEQWVRDPQEKHRLSACDAAVQAGSRAPAHWAAMAAFWATGNMTPDSGVAISPPPFLYARAVVSALEFAAARFGKRRDEFFSQALQRGLSLASGGDGS